jgi:hypothetical protein
MNLRHWQMARLKSDQHLVGMEDGQAQDRVAAPLARQRELQLLLR